MKRSRFGNHWAIAGVLAIGAILRTIQYGALASFSSDEAALAVSVSDRALLDLLLQPLAYYQVAPAGFLALEKLGVAILGNNEAALRLFPYLLSLASLALFWRVAARYLGFVTLLGAMIVFAMSPTLVLYSGMAKQYSGDITATLLLLWITLRCLEEPPSKARAVLFAIAGGLAVLLSHSAVLVAAALGTLILVAASRDRPLRRPAIAICAGWAVGAAILTYTALATYSAETSAFMEGWWRDDFVPPPWQGLGELLWIPTRLAGAAAYVAAYVNSPSSLPEYAFVGVYGILLLAGIAHLTRKAPWKAAALAVPLVVGVAAAAVRLLPLAGRVSLFLGPPLLIWSFGGFDGMRAWLPALVRPLVRPAALALAIFPVIALLFVIPPPIVQADSLAIFREVGSRWRPGDELVVSRGVWARVMADYYGRRFGVEGWNHLDRLWGQYTAEEILRGYLVGIDARRGAPRAWFYLDGLADCEREAMLGYLSAIGREIYSVDSRVSRGGKVSAHLFDLSNPERLDAASAESWPVPECRD